MTANIKPVFNCGWPNLCRCCCSWTTGEGLTSCQRPSLCLPGTPSELEARRHKSTNARMFLETKLSTLAKIQANLFQKLQSDKKILKSGQLPHVARCKLLHIQSKKIQLHFSRDFMSEKCYQPRDSNPQPSCVDVSLCTASSYLSHKTPCPSDFYYDKFVVQMGTFVA